MTSSGAAGRTGSAGRGPGGLGGLRSAGLVCSSWVQGAHRFLQLMCRRHWRYVLWDVRGRVWAT